MKYYLYLFTFCMISFFSCSSDSDQEDTTTTPEENVAPDIPLLVYPSNNLVCIENILKFQWNPAVDPEGSLVNYEIQIARDNTFTEIVSTLKTSNTASDISLFRGVMYYWRVKAIDDKKASSAYSEIYNFYTEGEGVANYLPFAPTLIFPENNSELTEDSVTLNWSAEDADGDVLTYDIYFGTDKEALQIIAEDISEVKYDAVINTKNSYYWKVVAKDNKGGSTIGQIWRFVKI
ncbi:hypothetical protein QLS71_002930 [Mariniflexile litorale]|uniref:Fibronectin type-III domain-containing protein n=1 Tax=Mariniflexile litorale TaxID=3045158 RepID=A0AAU7EI43_9FLAO|nr:hypothetical protein [Mariniflexile sp. KMM 9835]MDQ8209973.1 hypothetical protein [Mariniflexile sp. KMM 9835]